MEKPYVVGIDIGGTNTVFGVVDARGTILYSSSIKTGKYTDVDDYVSELANGLKLVIDQAGGVDKIKGIGVGAPNGNFFNGCIEFAPNLPWKGKIPLAQLISEKVGGVPVALTNDANAAAIGEMTYGAARGMKDFIVITLGTGVGSGIVIGGNLVYGHDGFAGVCRFLAVVFFQTKRFSIKRNTSVQIQDIDIKMIKSALYFHFLSIFLFSIFKCLSLLPERISTHTGNHAIPRKV